MCILVPRRKERFENTFKKGHKEGGEVGRQNTGMKGISHGKKKRIFFFFVKTEYSKREKRKSNILK